VRHHWVERVERVERAGASERERVGISREDRREDRQQKAARGLLVKVVLVRVGREDPAQAGGREGNFREPEF
jgi:hypothetical protein